jgi:type II secretory pathway component PulF
MNTESPAWAIDRLSILVVKIYHMKEESVRQNATLEHRQKCALKLSVQQEQHNDLSNAIDELLEDIEKGHKFMKVYKQMKMYNDPTLNPILYSKK